MSAARSRPSGVAGLRRGMTAAAPPADLVADLPQGNAAPEHRPRPEKPVRFTLDLDRDRHQFLKRYTGDIEVRGAAEVLRALLDELRDDPELAARVRNRIWQNR